MTETTIPLDELRRQADALDTALFDLVLRRLALGATSMPALDPAHEAQTMRALARQWSGPVAASVGLRMWREMIGATFVIWSSPMKASTSSRNDVERSFENRCERTTW